jgi:pimeloyl-ACP methyl ester carboxylesterase
VDEGWVEREAVRLHYLEWRPVETPRTPAVFLLHGLSSNARVWARLAARLPHRQIVALDQRSHGLSDRPPTGNALEDVVADAAHAIRKLAPCRPLVVGHSWGAAVALSLAAAHPELVSGLVVVDGAISSFSRLMSWEEAAQRMQPPLPTYRDLDAAAEAQAEYLGDAWGDDLREFVRAGLVEAPAGGLVSTLTADVRREILRDLYEFQPELLFAEVQGPVLLAMAGLLWPGAPSEFAERRRRSVEEAVEVRPDAQVRWYESRHDVPLIRPAELADDVERTAIAAEFTVLAQQAAELIRRTGLDWTRPVHGTGGWNAKDVLAHLSSSQAATAGVIGAPPRTERDGAHSAFDPARWNDSQLRRRRERTPVELADEMRRGAEQAHAALMGAGLDVPTAVGTFAGLPLRDAMERMLAHQRGHLGELQAAMALSGDSTSGAGK